jgi:hypothetical protein
MNRTLEYLDHNIEDLMTQEELGLVGEYADELDAIEDCDPVAAGFFDVAATGQEG